MPGEHTIEVSAPGYQPWRKHIVVRSGISNEFWNITLAREAYEATRYTGTENFTRYFQSPEPTLFAGITETESGIAILLHDTEEETGTILFSRDHTRFALEPHENIEWSPEGDMLVFPISLEGTRHVMTVDTQTKEARDLSLELNQFSLYRPRWNPELKNSLLYLAENALYRLDFDTSQQTLPKPTLLASDIITYDLSGSDIYIYKKNGELLFFNAQDTEGNAQSVTTIPDTTEYTAGSTLVVYDEDRIALTSPRGTLLFFNAYAEAPDHLTTLASGDITGVQFSDDGKKLLFFSEHDISVYFIQEWEVQPKRTEGDVWQIGRFADTISNVQWTKDYEHVLYLKDSRVFVSELDNRDQRNIQTLMSFSHSPLQILSRISDNHIFFVSRDGDTPTLISINFPEFNGFFTR